MNLINTALKGSPDRKVCTNIQNTHELFIKHRKIKLAGPVKLVASVLQILIGKMNS